MSTYKDAKPTANYQYRGNMENSKRFTFQDDERVPANPRGVYLNTTKSGDIVIHKTGGPTLLVINITPDGKLRCSYWNPTKGFETHDFLCQELEKP